MSDHHHYGYAEARHDHRGEYAADRHDHDLDYAEKHHRHYDDESTARGLREDLGGAEARIRELEDGLADALARIRQLEQQTPQARQLEHEADLAAADRDDDEPEDEPEDEPWRSTLADYAVASGAAEYDDGEPGASPFEAVPRLRRVTCMRTVMVDGNPEPCGLPVDHDPDEKCPGNPHARPAPEASKP